MPVAINPTVVFMTMLSPVVAGILALHYIAAAFP